MGQASPAQQGGNVGPGISGLEKRVYEILEEATPGDRTSQNIELY